MGTQEFQIPDFLDGLCTAASYRRWLTRKAATHVRRDRIRGNPQASVREYKQAIHAAVVLSRGRDAYTGLPMRWDLLSKYSNDAARAGRRAYKSQFGDLPTVDHIGDGTRDPAFHICSWRTNDAKNDLTYDAFTTLCRQVLEYEHEHRAAEEQCRSRTGTSR